MYKERLGTYLPRPPQPRLRHSPLVPLGSDSRLMRPGEGKATLRAIWQWDCDKEIYRTQERYVGGGER